MKKSDCTLKITSVDGVVTNVVLNGEDISLHCTAVEFRHIAGRLPEATVTMIPDSIEVEILGSVATKTASLC